MQRTNMLELFVKFHGTFPWRKIGDVYSLVPRMPRIVLFFVYLYPYIETRKLLF